MCCLVSCRLLSYEFILSALVPHVWPYVVLSGFGWLRLRRHGNRGRRRGRHGNRGRRRGRRRGLRGRRRVHSRGRSTKS